ncbi:UNVERIFIED_CONTAM: hypothetical protein FKN15_065885 [Acipenser sinensis]
MKINYYGFTKTPSLRCLFPASGLTPPTLENVGLEAKSLPIAIRILLMMDKERWEAYQREHTPNNLEEGLELVLSYLEAAITTTAAQPKWEEPERPQPKWEEPERPQPKWEEPERPQPKREEPERPTPEREEPERPTPEREEPERPMPEREEPERPTSEREERECPTPEREEPERPTSEREEPECPTPEWEEPERDHALSFTKTPSLRCLFPASGLTPPTLAVFVTSIQYSSKIK